MCYTINIIQIFIQSMKRPYGHISMAMVFSALLGVGAGILITLPFSGTKIGSQYQRGFEAGFADAKLKLDESGLIPEEPAEITSISGVITSIIGNTLSIKSDPVTVNPLAPPAPIERIILLTSETTLTRLTPKPPKQFNEEQAAWIAALAKLKQGEKPVNPPSPSFEQSASRSDLKPGVRLTVISNSDIKMLQKIEAKMIQI